MGIDIVRIIGAYGGSALENVYLNGDRVGYVTVAYLCTLHASSFTLDDHEVLETRWVTFAELARSTITSGSKSAGGCGPVIGRLQDEPIIFDGSARGAKPNCA